MTWLFFVDESGHDHKSMPYEVRGGFAIHVGKLWDFVQDMKKLEVESFGCSLEQYNKEIKGSTLVDRKRFRFSRQRDLLLDRDRQRFCRSFFIKNLRKITPSWEEFTAYGQACLRMAQKTFDLLGNYEAVAIATAIPRGVEKPDDFGYEDYLRKDIVFLLERFFYFLERESAHGILIMDETEKSQDRRFVAKIEAYFTKTSTGRYRTSRIVPTPFFVSSDMTPAVQAADLCIYCVNWGFRLPSRGMNAESRPEISSMFGKPLADLQFRGQGYRDGEVFDTYGIAYVPDPYVARHES